MESVFMEWLKSIPTFYCIIVVLGGIGVGYKIYKWAKKMKDNYDNKVKAAAKKSEEDTEVRQSMLKQLEQIGPLRQEITEIKDKQTELSDQQKEISKTLENFQESTLEKIDVINKRDSAQDDKLAMLIESDKGGIQSFIVNEHQKWMKAGYIDLHSLHIIKDRYARYLQENGDSFVESLMADIDSLPIGSFKVNEVSNSSPPKKRTTRRSSVKNKSNPTDEESKEPKE